MTRQPERRNGRRATCDLKPTGDARRYSRFDEFSNQLLTPDNAASTGQNYFRAVFSTPDETLAAAVKRNPQITSGMRYIREGPSAGHYSPVTYEGHVNLQKAIKLTTRTLRVQGLILSLGDLALLGDDGIRAWQHLWESVRVLFGNVESPLDVDPRHFAPQELPVVVEFINLILPRVRSEILRPTPTAAAIVLPNGTRIPVEPEIYDIYDVFAYVTDKFAASKQNLDRIRECRACHKEMIILTMKKITCSDECYRETLKTTP